MAAKNSSADFLDAKDQKQVLYAALGTGLRSLVYRQPQQDLKAVGLEWWKRFSKTQTSLGEIKQGLEQRLQQAASSPELLQLVTSLVPGSESVIQALTGVQAAPPPQNSKPRKSPKKSQRRA